MLSSFSITFTEENIAKLSVKSVLVWREKYLNVKNREEYLGLAELQSLFFENSLR